VLPNGASVDPFIEFNSDGFRGDTAYTCNRACSTRNDVDSTLLGGESASFTAFCGVDSTYGFADRGFADKNAVAPAGAFYWWNGAPQVMPNVDYQTAALEYAQTAYFITIIIVQWADLLIAKTRKLSVFEQGMGNDFMNFGLIFETVLGATLCYTPAFNQVFGTRPLHILHWFSGVPWSMLIFIYDELRKAAIRGNPGGWLDRWTYW
jgi:sodium/potassium-transporting ATPase subunit alpha